MKINSVGQNDAINKYVESVNRSTEKTPPVVTITDKLELSEGAQKFSEMLKAAKSEMEKARRTGRSQNGRRRQPHEKRFV